MILPWISRAIWNLALLPHQAVAMGPFRTSSIGRFRGAAGRNRDVGSCGSEL
jgi:hypothetical protein